MIEFLRGIVLSKETGHLLLDVHGVGYGLHIPDTTLEQLPDIGAEAQVRVSLVLREDSLTLYGFTTVEEKKVFEIFLGISGIGPRTALDVFAGERARRIGAGCGSRRYVMPVPGEDFRRAMNQRAAAPHDLARAGIIDQCGIPVAGYGICSRFFVKL